MSHSDTRFRYPFTATAFPITPYMVKSLRVLPFPLTVTASALVPFMVNPSNVTFSTFSARITLCWDMVISIFAPFRDPGGQRYSIPLSRSRYHCPGSLISSSTLTKRYSPPFFAPYRLTYFGKNARCSRSNLSIGEEESAQS